MTLSSDRRLPALSESAPYSNRCPRGELPTPAQTRAYAAALEVVEGQLPWSVGSHISGALGRAGPGSRPLITLEYARGARSVRRGTRVHRSPRAAATARPPRSRAGAARTATRVRLRRHRSRKGRDRR